MSWKLSLEVGYFDPDTCIQLPLRIEAAAAREAIVRARGRLLDRCGLADAQRRASAAAMQARTNREVLGFLGGECVLLHQSGFLITTIGYGPHRPMYAFLHRMCREQGCEVYAPDDAKIITEEILTRLAAIVAETGERGPMATDVYQVRVLSVDAGCLTCRVTVLYQGFDLAASPTLAFEFLCDAWDRLKDGRVNRDNGSFGINGPITADEARALANQTPFPPDQDIVDEEWVHTTANRVIRSVEVMDHDVCPPGENANDSQQRNLSATYLIHVADAGWLAHLRPGMQWRTTAYPME
jgi:hypothetical protein